MHGIDGRWHDAPSRVDQPLPVPPTPAAALSDADSQELRFTLKELFLATTIAAVMLALFRSMGIMGAVLSCLAALIVTLLGIPKFFPKDLPRQRLVFDFVWGMVMPIVCLVFDPFVFKSGEDLMGTLEPDYPPNFAAQVQVNELAYFAWPILVGQIATLGMVLAWGKSLRPIAPFLAGALATGFVISTCLGVLLVLPAMLGVFAFGIGLLGFTPIFTAITFCRRMRLMWLLSSGWKPEEAKFLLAGLGILICLALAVLVGATTLAVAPPKNDGPFGPHWLD